MSRIKVRSFRFKAPEDMPRYWYKNDPILTHAFNAGLIMFPKGERFFIEVVSGFRKQITNPQLLSDIKMFSAQEAHHSNVHALHNELLKAQGYDIDSIERDQDKKFRKIKKLLSRKRQLAIVVAYEHFTAMFGEAVLKDPRWLEGLPPTYVSFLRWHAAEEIEHKSVAFNVYQSIGGGYFTRVSMMVIAFAAFYKSVISYMRYFLKADGIKGSKAIIPLLKFMFISPGSFFQLALGHIKYFSPWFHPDKTQNMYLVDQWRQHDKAEIATIHAANIVKQND